MEEFVETGPSTAVELVEVGVVEKADVVVVDEVTDI